MPPLSRAFLSSSENHGQLSLQCLHGTLIHCSVLRTTAKLGFHSFFSLFVQVLMSFKVWLIRKKFRSPL
jgi:hypothetical protein